VALLARHAHSKHARPRIAEMDGCLLAQYGVTDMPAQCFLFGGMQVPGDPVCGSCVGRISAL